jgi:hypothetical protein
MINLTDLLSPEEFNAALHAISSQTRVQREARGKRLKPIFDEITKCATANLEAGRTAMWLPDQLYEYRSMVATLDFAVEFASMQREKSKS